MPQPRQLEKAEEIALAPYKAAVTARKEKARLESEKQARRSAAEWKADHATRPHRALPRTRNTTTTTTRRCCRDADRLRPLIREALIEELLENPDMSGEEIRESIEDQIDDELDDDD